MNKYINKIALALLICGLKQNYNMMQQLKLPKFIKITSLLKLPKNNFSEYNYMIGKKELSKEEINLLKSQINYILNYIENLSINNQYKVLKKKFDDEDETQEITIIDLLKNNYNILICLNNYFDANSHKIKIDENNFNDILKSFNILKNLLRNKPFNISSNDFTMRSYLIYDDYDINGNIKVHFILEPIVKILQNIFGQKYNLKELFDIYL